MAATHVPLLDLRGNERIEHSAIWEGDFSPLSLLKEFVVCLIGLFGLALASLGLSVGVTCTLSLEGQQSGPAFIVSILCIVVSGVMVFGVLAMIMILLNETMPKVKLWDERIETLKNAVREMKTFLRPLADTQLRAIAAFKLEQDMQAWAKYQADGKTLPVYAEKV